MLRFAIIYLFLIYSASGSTPLGRCLSRAPLPDNFEFGYCTSSPCPVTKGQTYIYTLTFQASTSSSRLDVYISYNLIPIYAGDACTSGVACPVSAGTIVSITKDVTISDTLLGGTHSVQFNVLDSLSAEVTCGVLKVTVP